MVRKSNSWITFIIRVWSKSYSDWWSYVALSYTTLSKFVAKKPFQVWYQNEKQGAFPYRWTNALPFASLTQPEKKAMDLDWGWGCDWTSTNERASKSQVTSHESCHRVVIRIVSDDKPTTWVKSSETLPSLTWFRRGEWEMRDERAFISFHFISFRERKGVRTQSQE